MPGASQISHLSDHLPRVCLAQEWRCIAAVQNIIHVFCIAGVPKCFQPSTGSLQGSIRLQSRGRLGLAAEHGGQGPGRP